MSKKNFNIKSIIDIFIFEFSRSSLQEAMNATTHDFLHRFTPKLDHLFDTELSLVYLNGMNGHLQTFYSDVLSELETKENDMLGRIEGK